MEKYWKKLILFALLLSATVFLGKGNVKAATIIDSGSCGENATYTLDSDGVLTISGSGEISDSAFAAAYYNASKAYENVEKIETVIIGDGITRIGDSAFAGCSNLKSALIPEGVTEIGGYSFRGCGLTDITIPESTTTIGQYAFYECGKIESLYIPKNVMHIETGAFSNVEKSITVADDNITFNSNNNCNAIIETATNRLIIGCGATVIPSNVTKIKPYAFSECESLTSIVLPEGVTSIGFCAFLDCSGLTSITISEEVMSIESAAFEGCSRLTSITIPEGVTSIESGTFKGCSGLTSITIPDRVTSIGGWAFYDCSRLTSVTIPDGVTSIGRSEERR